MPPTSGSSRSDAKKKKNIQIGKGKKITSVLSWHLTVENPEKSTKKIRTNKYSKVAGWYKVNGLKLLFQYISNEQTIQKLRKNFHLQLPSKRIKTLEIN